MDLNGSSDSGEDSKDGAWDEKETVVSKRQGRKQTPMKKGSEGATVTGVKSSSGRKKRNEYFKMVHTLHVPWWFNNVLWGKKLPPGYQSHCQIFFPRFPWLWHFNKETIEDFYHSLPFEVVKTKRSIKDLYIWMLENRQHDVKAETWDALKIMNSTKTTKKLKYKSSWITDFHSVKMPHYVDISCISRAKMESNEIINSYTLSGPVYSSMNTVIKGVMKNPETNSFDIQRKGLVDKMTGKLLEYFPKFYRGNARNKHVIHAGVHYLLDGEWKVATEEKKIRDMRQHFCNTDEGSQQNSQNHLDICSESIYGGNDLKEAPKYLFIEGHPKFKHIKNINSPPTSVVITNIDVRTEGQCCPSCQSQLCKEYEEVFATENHRFQWFHCGGSLCTGELCFIDGRDCHLNANVYYVGVYRVDKDCKTTCKIGVVKTLFHLVGYFMNRYCIIQSIYHYVPPNDGKRFDKLRNTCIHKMQGQSSITSGVEKKRKIEQNKSVNNTCIPGLSKMFHGVLSDDVICGENFAECFVMKGRGVARAILLDRYGSKLVMNDP